MKSISPQLVKLAEKLVRQGKKSGADEIQVSVSEGREFNVKVLNGEVEKLVEAGSRALSLKVIINHQVAIGSTSDLSEDTLNYLLSNTIERAKLSGSDPFSGLPDLEPVTVSADQLELTDPAIPEMSPESKIERARDLEALCMQSPKVGKSYGAGFSTYVGNILLVNSNGFSNGYSRTHCSHGITLQAGEGDHLFDDGWVDSARHLKDLASVEIIAEKAVNRVTRMIGARKVETTDVPVIFEPQETASLMQFLIECADGKNIYLNNSFLTGKLGEQIASPLLSIADNPHIPGGIGSRPFDGEGVPTRFVQILGNGILDSYLLNTYEARKLNMKSTGHASGVHNVSMKSGTDSPESIIKSVDRGLLLTDTIGFGRIPSTGDISQGAFGMWIENGEPAFPVAEITISGNLGTMLQGIEMIGNDPEKNRSISGPTIKINSMTISGK